MKMMTRMIIKAIAKVMRSLINRGLCKLKSNRINTFVLERRRREMFIALARFAGRAP